MQGDGYHSDDTGSGSNVDYPDGRSKKSMIQHRGTASRKDS